MLTKTKLHLFTLMIAFVFLMSAISTVPAYADGETPPVEPPAATEPLEPPAQDEGTEEAPDSTQEPTLSQDEPAPVTEETPPVESVESILAEVPQGTEVVVVNEEGESVPLATEEAAEIIVNGDPMWCPATVAVPTAGMSGCTTPGPGNVNYNPASLGSLITYLTTTQPGVDGTIWIASNYNSANDNAAITINGASFTNMDNFKLTLKGGWCDGTDVTCVGLIDISKPSKFDVPILIINWNNDVTLSNIIITGTASGTNGLEVGTTKNITLTNIQSNNNPGRGAHLHNDGSGTGNVTVTNSKFTGNSGPHGLFIQSNGVITLKDVTAGSNTSGYGAYLDNDAALTPKAVTLSGTNNFNYNGNVSGSSGLYVTSKGQITVNNVVASNNGNGGFGQGAELYNNVGSSTSGVTLTGTNIFTDNEGNGLSIITFGAIKANNLHANSNDGLGAYLFNSGAGTSQAVTLTGTNEFKYNGSLGLSISSKGQITLNNISANSNGNVGASLNNIISPTAAGVTLTGTNYLNDNFYTGIIVQSSGIVTMNNVTANGNGASNSSGYGMSISNGGLVNFKGVTLTGNNFFSNNYEDGLVIISSGVVTLNNITASNNERGHGVRIDNTASGVASPKAVTLNGTNQFNNNWYIGLQIDSNGAITTNSITANENGQGGFSLLGSGVDLNNDGANTPQKVTLKGSNNFNDNDETGLHVITDGAILTNAITATGNGDYGVFLSNNSGTAASTVTMTGTNLITGSALDNLFIQSASTIVLNNITASFSSAGMGANISNTTGIAKAVTITGMNAFNSNFSVGLFVSSNGAITVNNLTASSNIAGSNGARLDNTTSTTKAGVTLTGSNTFNGNLAGHGLFIFSLGNVKTNNITANSNGGSGVKIDVTAGGAIGSVTMNGFNNFNANTNTNLDITAVGAIILNGINSTASANGDGAHIINLAAGTATPKPVTLTGTNIFSNNANGNGLAISSYGLITTNNINASNNGSLGSYLLNSGAVTPAGINILGTNLFDSNAAGGSYVESQGLIKTNNITSNNSAGGYGASLNNGFAGIKAGITLTGINSFNGNRTSGLEIVTNGAITASNITASLTTNGFGASFNNTGSGNTAPKAITLSGNNNFNSSHTSGLIIDSYGAVTINNLTASYNGWGLATGIGADIDNNASGATIALSVTLTGNNSFIDNYQQGLYIESFGAIKVNNLTANLNGNQSGAQLDNNNAPTNAFGVTLTGKSIFDDNVGNGLKIDTKGAVIIGGINSTNNSVYGAQIINNYAGPVSPKPITLTGANVFSNNDSTGLSITTNGVVTISSVTASGSIGGFGASIDNSGAGVSANVVFTGFNVFNNNGLNGLVINSKGAVTLSNITANDNTFSGLDVNNSTGTASVTLTGINTFNGNGDNGATILSSGTVNLTKVTGDENGQSGLVVSTTAAVTITCGSFNLNNWYGWEVSNALSSLTIKGVFTAGNTLGDFINNASSTVTVRNCPLP